MVVLNNMLFNIYLRDERERERKRGRARVGEKGERKTWLAKAANLIEKKKKSYLYGCFFRTYFIK